jgi:tetratricopeptide (TPR) repeat protein
VTRFKFLALLFFPIFAQAQLPDMSQIEKEYVEKCGGKTYSKCDDKEGQAGLSQASLFEVAQMSAIAQGKLVFLVIGADWCPSCRTLARDFSENPALKFRLEQKYVPVNINGEAASAKALARKLKINIIGFPQVAIYDPAQNKVLDRFFASSEGSSETLVDYLETFAQSRKVVTDKANIRESLLLSPVARSGGFGESKFSPSTQLSGPPKEQFTQFMRQGMLYFHAFHWINAIRSFNSALRLENNPVALALLAMAKTKAESITSTPVLMMAIEADSQAKDAAWMSKEDRRFVAFARDVVAEMSPELCKATSGVDGPSYDKAVTAALNGFVFNGTDYLAILAYKSWRLDLFEEIVKIDPEHGGRAHYLTHLAEAVGQIPEAAAVAEHFARSAPGSAHAQHMYGHILPQVGKWPEAMAQFQIAHDIHQREFREEGILKSEDWHYSHNLDLLISTMLYLGKSETAEALIKNECTDDSFDSCFVAFNLYLANGKYALAEKILNNKMKAYLNSPSVVDLRILLALGQGNLAAATALVESLKRTDDWKEPGTEFSGAAFGLITKSLSEEAVLPALQQLLSRPGFDSWSVGVLKSRALVRVLEGAGLEILAEKIRGLAISAFEKKVCKTAICIKQP